MYIYAEFFDPGFGTDLGFSTFGPGHSCSGTTFRHIVLLQDDISIPAALGLHFDLSCCSGMAFRLILLLQDDIFTYPAAPGRHFDGRHFDLSSPSGTTFRPILLLLDDISTYPAALGRHFE